MNYLTMPPRRWLWWPWCALTRHRTNPGAWCRCRGVVSYRIEADQ